jgi:hypothetical protein
MADLNRPAIGFGSVLIDTSIQRSIMTTDPSIHRSTVSAFLFKTYCYSLIIQAIATK